MSTDHFVLSTPGDISRLASLPGMLRYLGWRVRSRNRADCALCRGHSTGTVSFTVRLWKCHRCGAGGDVFTLVQDVRKCGFRDALRFVAELGGIPLKGVRTASRSGLASKRQQRERIQVAADTLELNERALRIACRNQIHDCERILERQSPWNDIQWTQARAAQLLRDEFLLPVYTLLSFAAIASRIEYVIANDRDRARMATAVRFTGGVHTESGQWQELVQ